MKRVRHGGDGLELLGWPSEGKEAGPIQIIKAETWSKSNSFNRLLRKKKRRKGWSRRRGKGKKNLKKRRKGRLDRMLIENVDPDKGKKKKKLVETKGNLVPRGKRGVWVCYEKLKNHMRAYSRGAKRKAKEKGLTYTGKPRQKEEGKKR